MAKVLVTVLNNSEQTVTIALDDEADAERIEYFHTLKRRGDIADVQVKKVAAQAKLKADTHQKAGSGGAGDAG